MKRALVTGITGRDGSYLAAFLLAPVAALGAAPAWRDRRHDGAAAVA